MTYHEAMAIPTRAKLRVKDFLVLDEAGAFDDYGRTELIDGEIWILNGAHRPHARIHALLAAELTLALRDIRSLLEVYSAPSTEVSEYSMPEPDIVLGERSEDRTVHGRTVKLAVEVSDTTLSRDLGIKARLYAEVGIPEYWVVDVNAGVIHQLWSPDDSRYRERRDNKIIDGVVSATIPDLALPGFSVD